MNKKTYLTPRSTAIHLLSEGMVAASPLQINSDAEKKNEQLTSRQGWSSDNWTNSDDEE
jgi:hypothetical protein